LATALYLIGNYSDQYFARKKTPRMKLIVVNTSNDPDNPGALKLKASLERFGYEYQHITHPFSFGHQLPVIQQWCLNYKGEATHLCYSDCFDTLALAGPDEVIEKFQLLDLEREAPYKMLISAEKNCYPHPERAKDYPETNTPWKYVNGGGWLVEIEYFKYLCDKERLTSESHDQVWLMEAYLRNQGEIKLDTNCEIFQTIAFSNQDEWEKVGERLRNVGTGALPVFYHGNGKTDMKFVYDVLNL
jgi:hypothetical protein